MSYPEYSGLLSKISQRLDQLNRHEHLLFMCRRHIASRPENIPNALSLFRELEEQNNLGIDQLELLKDLLRGVEEWSLIQKVRKFEEKRKEYNELLEHISRSLDESNQLQQLIAVCTERETLEENEGNTLIGRVLFEKLERRGRFAFNRLAFLKEILSKIERQDLVKKVQDFEKRRIDEDEFERRKAQAGSIVAAAYGKVTGVLKMKTLCGVAAAGITLLTVSDILTRWSTYDQLVAGFQKCVLPAGSRLIEVGQGCVCFTIQVDNLMGLTALWNRYEDGTLKERLFDFFVTDEMKTRAGGEDNVELTVTIEREEYEKAYCELVQEADGNQRRILERGVRRHSDSVLSVPPKDEEKSLVTLTQVKNQVESLEERMEVLETQMVPFEKAHEYVNFQDKFRYIMTYVNDQQNETRSIMSEIRDSGLPTSGIGSDNSDEREGEQNEDHREEEYIPSQHPTGSCRNLSLLPRTVKDFINRYTLLEVIRDYCETKAKEREFREVILDARRMFISHFLTFLEDTFKNFLSQNVSEALDAFQMDEGNVLQLVEWCNNDQMDEEQTERCIDVFNNVAELLAKMMRKDKFKYSFESLQRRCEQMPDQKRLSDCLTSLGIEEVFRGSSQPTGLNASAAQKAKEYLTKADQIQRNLGINTGNSRAQCLSKLAQCLAKEGNFDEAKEKVQQAIKIRSDQGEDDKVMLGATYNDQAVILSLEGDHQLAIEVRKQTLKIYMERLGEHPFTATILNSLSNNYYALGKYDDAERCSEEALVIRRKLLKNHRDTAKSLFHLGMIHKMKEEFKPAGNYLEECEAMQKRILDENDDDLTSTRKELEDVKRRLAEPEGQISGGWPKPVEETLAGIHRNLSLLPRTVRHFVNRETECKEIEKYLSPENDCRCLLIHGATGMGKTTVAMKVANDILNSDRQTVVIYVNCRDIKLFHDFAAKVLQQIYHYPVDDPVAELKNRLKSQDLYTILLLDNFEFLLHLDDRMQPTGNELSHEQMNPSEEGSKIKNLINEILMVAGKVKLLLTSSEKVSFTEAGQETLRLSSFRPEESVELLKKVWKDRQINTIQAHDLSEICSGIPLVLFTLASSHSNLLSLLKEMNCSSAPKKIEFLKKIQTVPADRKINFCIDHCFGRLDLKEKCALISFALFRRRFSLHEAEQMFQSTTMSLSELTQCGLELSRRSLLEQHIIGDDCFYTLLRVIRDYCETKAMEREFREVILDARRMFIRHFVTFLEHILKNFLSQNVSEAIAAFQMDEGNVLQLVEWCSNGQMDKEQTERCIDVFNSVAEFLAKMMGKAKFKDAFESLRRRCEEMKDQKRLSDCLTSLGIEEVFSCSCPPIGLCASAARRAKAYLTEADQIQRNLEISTGDSRAQCLSKLARCLAKERNFDEAKEKVQQAIDIRVARGEEDIVMLGATYNDQGVILSLEENHRLAIDVREKQTLPIYKTRLGDHPFSATILNNLSNNYFALGKYDDAERYSKEALDIRYKLLKDHRDTAKSLFDLGMAHKMKKEFVLARKYLEWCQAVQQKILDENNNDLKRTTNELEEVKRSLTDAERQSNGSS